MSTSLNGRVYRPMYTYQGERRESNVFWIDYSVNGTRHRESSKSDKREDAERLLALRLAEAGKVPEGSQDASWETLEDLIREDYRRNGNKSSVDRRLAQLRTFFGGRKASSIDEAAIRGYVNKRTADRKRNGEPYAPATVNRELSALRRMLHLARRSRLVARVPDFGEAMLKERNVRKGFVTLDQMDRLEEALPPRLRPLARAAFITGWRKSELLSRKWEHVDFAGGWLRLEPGESKSGDGRSFPLIPELRDLLERQREKARETEERHGAEVTHVFFYYAPSRNRLPAGRPIATFRRSWKTACEEAGLPDLLFHDLRRSAIRQATAAGVPANVARAFSGHKTMSVFDRYNIVDARTLEEQAAKLSDAYQRHSNGKESQESAR